MELIDTPDYEQIKRNFLQELTRASLGKPSSISFLKHYMPAKPLLTQGIIQIFVIGGTNYIVETLKIQPDGKRVAINKRNGILPIFATKKILIDFFSSRLNTRTD